MSICALRSPSRRSYSSSARGCTPIMRLMMNSRRARPTPWLGMPAKSNARSGLPTFIMIFTGICGSESSSIWLALVLEQAGVDVAGVALGAGDGDLLALADALRGIAAADHRGDAELARDDGRVTGAAAAVGDDRRRALHHRLPVRIGHVGDQHVAGLHARHLGDVPDDARGSGADPLADAAAGAQDLRARLQGEALDRAAGAALHGLRARLQDEDLAAGAVLAPLDVHGLAVVLLDDERLAGERTSGPRR